MAESASSGEMSSDLVIVMEKWLNEAKLGEGLIADMSPRVFLVALNRFKRKQKLTDLRKNTSATDNQIWIETIREMKQVFPDVSFSVKEFSDSEEVKRGREKAKLALAIYFAATQEKAPPAAFSAVTGKWTGPSAKTLSQALKTLQGAKCHGKIGDLTFERAFDPRIPTSGRKPVAPRPTFSVPKPPVTRTRTTPAPARPVERTPGPDAALVAEQGKVAELERRLAAAVANQPNFDEERTRLTAINTQLQSRLDEIEARVHSGNSAELKSISDLLHQQIEDARGNRSLSDDAVRDLKDKLEATLAQAEEMNNLKLQLGQLKFELAAMQSKLDSVEHERAAAVSSAENLTSEIAKLREQLDQEAEKHSTVVSELKARIEEFESFSHSVQEELQQKIDYSEKQEEDINRLNQQIANFSAQHQQLTQTLQDVSTEYEQLKEQYAQVTAANAAAVEVEKFLRQELKAAEDAKAEIDASRTAVLNELNVALDQITQKTYEHEEYAAAKDRELDLAVNSARDLEETLRNQMEVVSDQLKASEESNRGLADSIVALTEDKKKYLAELARAQEEVAKRDEELFAVREDLRHVEEEISQTVEELDAARKARQEMDKITAQTKAVSETQAAESARRIAELESQLVDLNAQLKAVTSEKTDLVFRASALEGDVSDLSARIAELTAANENLVEESERVAATFDYRVSELEKGMETERTYRFSAEDMLAETARYLEATEHQLAEAHAEDAIKKLKIAELEESLSAAQETNAKFLETQRGFQEQATELEELRLHASALEEKQKGMAKIAAEVDRLVRERDALAKKLADAEKRASAADDAAGRKIETVLEECDSALRNIQSGFEEKIETKDRQIAELQDTLNAATREIAELKNALEQLDARRKRELEEYAANVRSSSHAVQSQTISYNDMQKELLRAKAQIAYLEESIRTERAKNEDAARGGHLARSGKRRSRSSHDINRSFVHEDFLDGSLHDFSGPDRVEELKRRNSMYPNHLRSCYPLETSTQEHQENAVRQGLGESFWGRHDASFSSVDGSGRRPRETYTSRQSYLTEGNHHEVRTNSTCFMAYSPPKRNPPPPPAQEDSFRAPRTRKFKKEEMKENMP